MNSDGHFEEKKDLTRETDEKLPQADSLAATPGGLGAAIELLYGLEKQCRMGNDIANLKRVCLHIVGLCKKAGDFEKLTEVLNFLSKRRSQKNDAIKEIVKESMLYVEDAKDDVVKKKLVVCLRDMTDGRIYVEAERGEMDERREGCLVIFFPCNLTCLFVCLFVCLSLPMAIIKFTFFSCS